MRQCTRCGRAFCAHCHNKVYPGARLNRNTRRSETQKTGSAAQTKPLHVKDGGDSFAGEGVDDLTTFEDRTDPFAWHGVEDLMTFEDN